jgi:hypothetical protein
MGQFKPMVKMMTTEPSVELKLKKGGAVKKPVAKADGGAMRAAAPAGRMSSMSVAAANAGKAPAKPSMASRRAAMRQLAPSGPMMKEGGESKAEHKAEMKTMAETSKKLKEHAAMPASKAHKGLKTGGVVMGQGGFKEGGSVADSVRGAEAYKNTKMHTAEYTGKTSGKTGEVKLGNAGGYKHGGKAVAKKAMGGSCYAKGGGVYNNVSTSKPGATNTTTGEVKLGNAGGYKKGGAPKKFAEGGSVKVARGGLNDSGKPVDMPQGNKTPPTPVSISKLSGTYKKGGSAKMNEGGKVEDLSKGAYDRALRKEEDMEMARMIRDIPSRMLRGVKSMMGMSEKPQPAPAGSVTKTEKSVTVSPAKKGGGRVKKAACGTC